MSDGGTSGRAVSAYLMNVSVKARWSWLTVSKLWNLRARAVRQIPKQRVDELLKIVALVGADSDEVVENLVVASGMKLRLQSSNALPLGAIEANRVTDDLGRLRSRHGSTIQHCTLRVAR